MTGAGRGIGRTIALQLARGGWTVHAGVRKLDDGERLAAEAPAGTIKPVVVDVTDEAAVKKLPDAVGGSLDALVNNAGISGGAPLEAVPLDDVRQQFEINVIGLISVTQAVLPLLRASNGRLVLIGSVSGRVAAPMLGPYSASKYAVEALADTFRRELVPWGIKVALIEPGSIDTDMWRNADKTATETEAKLSAEHRSLYADQLAGTRKLIARIQKQTAPPEKVADAVEHALTAARPKTRYLVGRDARVQATLGMLAPDKGLDFIMAKVGGAR